MRMKRLATMAIAIALFGAQLSSASVFASNQYNIDYSGGAPLGPDNVIIEPTFLDNVTPLIKANSVSTTPTQPDQWSEGYIKDSGVCRPAFYYVVNAGPLLQSVQQNRGFTISNGQYRVDVEILGETLEDIYEGSYSISILPNFSYVYAGWQIYTDDTCETLNENIANLRYDTPGKIFVEMVATLYKEGSTTPFIADDVYFGITDIDAAQSYMIINENNRFNSNNMFAISSDNLQPGTDGLRNMFVEEGSYIYSEHNLNGGQIVRSNDLANIYTELFQETQADGLNLVFGYSAPAASGLEYYIKQYTVQYDADENGKITGITDEDVFPGEYASGSSYKPNNMFKFLHWIADVDVVLEDGTEIKAGDPITDKQIKSVIVDKNIKFTAIFEDDIKVPNTGASTMDLNATQITISTIAILLLALMIRALPRLTHKKVNFNK